MTGLIRLTPADEDNYPNYPAVELHLVRGLYFVYTVDVDGEIEDEVACHNLIASLAYMTCILARTPEIEYVVETLN